MARLTPLAPSLTTVGYAVPGLVAIPAGLPWPAVLTLTLAVLATATTLKILREVYRHREILTALAKADAQTPLDVQPHHLTLGARVPPVASEPGAEVPRDVHDRFPLNPAARSSRRLGSLRFHRRKPPVVFP
jgi:hypothetical protein